MTEEFKGYRGGYAMFYDTVRQLVERGAFDASEVNDYQDDSIKPKISEFITLFPTRGFFRGCRAIRLEGCLYSVFQESDKGQYLERLELVGGDRLPDEFICELDLQEFTYARFDTSQFSRKKDFGKFRRPDKREEDHAQLERQAARKGKCPASDSAGPATSSSDGGQGNNNQRRRTFLNIKTKEQSSRQLPDTADGKSPARTGLPKISEVAGQGRLSHIRYRDDWKANIWQPGLSDSELRSMPYGEGDQLRHSEYVTRSGRKISLRLP